MRQPSKTPQTVDEYIARCAPEVQTKLRAVRIEARSNAPHADEKIGYGIPTLKMGKNIFHFAAFKNHIGLYPCSVALEVFSDELKMCIRDSSCPLLMRTRSPRCRAGGCACVKTRVFPSSRRTVTS